MRQSLKAARISLLGLLPVAGCQVAHTIPPASPLNTSPLVVDEAMQNRDWEPSAAAYQNDAVTANPTDWTLEPSRNHETASGLMEPGTYLLNLGLLPYAIIKDPPWQAQVSKATVMDPTYTGNPPLPASPVPQVK